MFINIVFVFGSDIGRQDFFFFRARTHASLLIPSYVSLSYFIRAVPMR